MMIIWSHDEGWSGWQSSLSCSEKPQEHSDILLISISAWCKETVHLLHTAASFKLLSYQNSYTLQFNQVF